MGTPPRLLLLYGDDGFTITQQVDVLRKELGPKTEAEMNTQRFPGPGLSAAQLRAAVTVIPFLAPRRLVIVEQAGKMIPNQAAQPAFREVFEIHPRHDDARPARASRTRSARQRGALPQGFLPLPVGERAFRCGHRPAMCAAEGQGVRGLGHKAGGGARRKDPIPGGPIAGRARGRRSPCGGDGAPQTVGLCGRAQAD